MKKSIFRQLRNAIKEQQEEVKDRVVHKWGWNEDN